MNIELLGRVIDIAGHVLIIAGLAFMFLGIVGIFRFRDFYPRVLVASKIDTVGMTTVFIGIMLRHGISFFSAKVLLIMVIILILNPLVSHFMARSAHAAGYQIQEDLPEADGNINAEEEDL